MRGRFSLTAVSYLILLAVEMATPRVWAKRLTSLSRRFLMRRSRASSMWSGRLCSGMDPSPS